ncbi:N-6 DNA methylase [Mycobacterium heidelbergense]|uniref:N-6 DNA methylase n=1 Tax=Mycobacterium heidelbergense TaxID=53376 RepID=UPI003CECFC46
MARFAAKAAPEGDKLRGGYYTPEPIARFVAQWAGQAGPRILEPSCGDGAILRELVSAVGRKRLAAIELIADEAKKAADSSGAPVKVADFFTWFTPKRYSSFDAVAANPPYIRFGSWDESFREPALALMRSHGFRPTKLTNAWVPFVVASVLAVRPGGRVALVLPAELLQVGYAAALRSYLIDNCSQITIVSFQRLVFPGILQEVVLLLAERGTGPAQIRTSEVPDASHLDNYCFAEAPAVRAHLHEAEKWTKYYLDAETISKIRNVRTDGRLQPLNRFAEVDVGVVTGRNSFFCLSATDATQRKLGAFTVPLVARSMQIPALSFTESDLAEQDTTDARTRLLALTPDLNLKRQTAVARYLEEGRADGVPEGYKCRIRRTWWEVPSTWVPDGFMLRQISTHPRLIANQAGATSTDTVHRVRVAPGVNMKRLAVGAFNSVTFALAEVLGRSYGGGILELEPSECGYLPVVDPKIVPKTLHQKADELVRERRYDDALDLVDQVVLVERLGFAVDEVAALRRAWLQMRDRRAARSKRADRHK